MLAESSKALTMIAILLLYSPDSNSALQVDFFLNYLTMNNWTGITKPE